MTHSVKLPAWDFRRGMATARVMTQVGCERGASLEVLLHLTGIAPSSWTTRTPKSKPRRRSS